MSKYKNSQSLFQLINTLKRSEKRYFIVRNTEMYNPNVHNYIKFYKLVEEDLKRKVKVQDRDLKKKVAKQIGQNVRYDLLKQNTYDKILESLVEYYERKFIRTKINRLIEQASILQMKGLTDHALIRIEKAIKLCVEHEKWNLLLESLELDRHLNYDLQKPSLDNNRELETLEILNEVAELRKVQSEVWQTYMVHGLPSNETIRNTYSSAAKYLKEKAPKSEVAKVLLLYCQQFLTGMLGKMEATYAWGKQLVSALESSPEALEDKVQLYIRCMINLQYPMIRLGKKSEIEALSYKLKSVLDKSTINPFFKSSILMSVAINEYDVSFKCAKYNELETKFHNLIACRETNKNLLTGPTEILFLWQSCLHNFVNAEYNDCLSHLIEIERRQGLREDVYSYAKILTLIIHFELGNLKLLEYALLNTYRFLKRKNRLGNVERLMFELVKRLSKINHRQMTKAIFLDLKEKIELLKGDGLSHEAMNLMYFEYYIVEKIKKRA